MKEIADRLLAVANCRNGVASPSLLKAAASEIKWLSSEVDRLNLERKVIIDFLKECNAIKDKIP